MLTAPHKDMKKGEKIRRTKEAEGDGEEWSVRMKITLGDCMRIGSRDACIGWRYGDGWALDVNMMDRPKGLLPYTLIFYPFSHNYVIDPPQVDSLGS